ncbi:methionine--tRNA ligase [Thermoproteota archaeon]
MKKRKILVTSALPYANGSIHLGHLVEYIQTDIWVRFQKLLGNTCYYMCADDTHGTAIMLSAKKQGITPQELIKKIHKEHIQDFNEFLIEFDNYYTTDSKENQELSEYIFLEAQKKGIIYEKEIEQMYCEHDNMFLPDRFIRGICPKCNALDQYGDSCEVCSSTYSPGELIAPKCAECGNTPVKKTSMHYFFKLSALTDEVKKWIDTDPVRVEIKNKLQEWFEGGIRDWDISRDAPYFGFKIPGAQDKYFYVWLDAPVGYIASTKNWCSGSGVDFDSIWRKGEYEIHHFIGKDIVYFHTLFWPAMLTISGFKLPKKVHVHGFLTINGEKMSKSRGTFINARAYLNHINPEFLRYYYASKLSGSIEDLDLNLEDFVFKVNSDIVNKVVNIGSRLGSILNKKLESKLTNPDKEGEALIHTILESKDQIAKDYNALAFHKAMREIMRLADLANQYIDAMAPWAVVKENKDKASEICTAGLNALRILSGYLKPVLPGISQGVERFLDCEPVDWLNLDQRLLNHVIQPYQHLAQRVELEQVKKSLATTL